LNMKIPEGKPTQAAICRAEKVRADIRSIEEQQHKQQVLAKRKDLASREAAAVLKTIISEVAPERHHHTGNMGTMPSQSFAFLTSHYVFTHFSCLLTPPYISSRSVLQREIERRQSHGGFIEISATQKRYGA
jgi:hypothetical protein